MKNYSEMSDHQINVLVAKALDGHADDKFPVQRRLQVFDPCNSWADGGAIIAERQISIIFDADLVIEPPAHWVVCQHVDKNGRFCEYYGQPSSPLRAAMIVFLMINEAENANS